MKPKPPPNLQPEAAAEWKRVVAELEFLDQLDRTDRAVCTLYVKAWQRYADAAAKVEELGLMVAAPRTKVPMQNPYLSIANKAHEQLIDALDALCLTPISRARLAKLRAKPDTADAELAEF